MAFPGCGGSTRWLREAGLKPGLHGLCPLRGHTGRVGTLRPCCHTVADPKSTFCRQRICLQPREPCGMWCLLQESERRPFPTQPPPSWDLRSTSSGLLVWWFPCCLTEPDRLSLLLYDFLLCLETPGFPHSRNRGSFLVTSHPLT